MVSSDAKKLRLLLSDCASGFYQQMYFLGKDVIHPRGNQLQQYGFEKSPSRGLKGTSCYSLESDEFAIELYGSCAAYYSDSVRTVFLRKRCRFYQWLPEHRLVAGNWSQEDIRLDDPERMLATITPFLQWWITYENWIENRLGSEHREYCFSEWNKVKGKRPWLPPVLAREWVQQFLEQEDQHVRPKHFA